MLKLGSAAMCRDAVSQVIAVQMGNIDGVCVHESDVLAVG
jgi:hypothetical protein